MVPGLEVKKKPDWVNPDWKSVESNTGTDDRIYNGDTRIGDQFSPFLSTKVYVDLQGVPGWKCARIGF